jgi:hypothetical protein
MSADSMSFKISNAVLLSFAPSDCWREISEGSQDTVKASNFGSHVNFGLFSNRTCYHQNASYRKMKKMKVVEKRHIST